MAKITIFGLAGTGTSTVGKMLAEKLGYEYVSSGDLFRAKAKELGRTLLEHNEISAEDPKYDRELDQEIERPGKNNENLVVESRLAWFFIPHSIKIKFSCELAERVRRVAFRDGEGRKKTREKILLREKFEADRYKKLYGISDYGADKNFDLVLDTTRKSIAENVAAIEEYLAKLKKSL